jgi:hypothetical protein
MEQSESASKLRLILDRGQNTRQALLALNSSTRLLERHHTCGAGKLALLVNERTGPVEQMFITKIKMNNFQTAMNQSQMFG